MVVFWDQVKEFVGSVRLYYMTICGYHNVYININLRRWLSVCGDHFDYAGVSMSIRLLFEYNYGMNLSMWESVCIYSILRNKFDLFWN